MMAALAISGVNTRLVILGLFLGARAPELSAQQETSRVYELETGGRLVLEGTATIGDYRCETRQIDGSAKLGGIREGNDDSAQSGGMNGEVRVSIPIRGFECGNRSMNSDMYDALKADSFPLIRYVLVHAEVVADTEVVDSARTLETSGEMTIAGVTKLVEMHVTIRRLSPERYQILGSKALSMHGFGITPPTALWGLIKADDRLVVRFDLVARTVPSVPKKEQ